MTPFMVDFENGSNGTKAIGWIMTPRQASGILVPDDICQRLELIDTMVVVIASIDGTIKMYSLENWKELDEEYPGAILKIMMNYIEGNQSWE
jgi:hypothetical protein